MLKFMFLLVHFFILSFIIASVLTQGRNHKILKCLVCQKIIEEVSAQVSKTEIQNKKVAIGGYHLDDQGNTNQQVVSYAHSDLYLNEMMDNLCELMKDYVRARRKSDKKLIILPLVLPGGKMNPEFSTVDPILDSDLNHSLGFYCHQIVNEYEEEMIERIKQGQSDNAADFCSSATPYCTGEEEDLEDIPPQPSLEEALNPPFEIQDEL